MIRRQFLLATLAASLSVPAAGRAEEKKPTAKKPRVEVVFCLDTTGSMGGLIEGAKAKIWSISNQIASGKPTPELKIGLVAYRDKGDAYVTQVYDLTGDLDEVHAKLKTFSAGGGGDTPEHVNQGLHDAVHKMKWSEDNKTLKIIFLVGDAPPHMDYNDDVKYPETCKKAVEKGIIINTIQCGTDANTAKAWQDICKKSEGSYVAIQQDGGVVAVATPFDKELSAINDEMTKKTLRFGDRRARDEAKEKDDAALKLDPTSKADRAGLAGKGAGPRGDLVDAVKRENLDLNKLKEADLPDEIRKLEPKARKGYIDKLDEDRKKLNEKALELDKKRRAYIEEELKKKGGKNAFDNQVLEMLRQQAEKVNIKY